MRRAISILSLAILLLAMANPVWAGGWAVSSFEDAPTEFVAGETYEMHYSILQHGMNPIDIDATTVVLTPTGGGDTLTFEGRSTGETGRYAVEVAVPAEGSWTWQVTQGIFEPQALGTMRIVEPTGWFPWSASQVMQGILPVATVAALILLLLQIADLRRQRSLHDATASPTG